MRDARYVLALDQGTTSSRSLIFDPRGRVIAQAQREFTQFFPQPGWVEHDAGEIWESQRATMLEALAAAKLAPADIAAVGISNQRETTVLWDRATGEPVARAIVWQDRRTATACEQMRAAGLEPEIAARTGLLLDPYFSATKLAWLLDHVPGARARAERGELAFGTVDSWLLYKLTAHRRHVTDATNASRTLLFNLRDARWDERLLEMFRVPRACLPEVVDSCLSREAALEIEPAPGVKLPLTGIAGDQQAALFGQACFTPGMAKNTYGTGCFLLMNTGTTPTPSAGGLLTTIAWKVGGEVTYALEGAVFIAGAAVQWMRDGLRAIVNSADIEQLATSVPDAGGVYLVPAFVGLGAPHWDPYARGTIIGLTRDTTVGHIARATVDAMAYQSRDVLALMEKDAGVKLAALRVDGGASVNNSLLQFQADLLDVQVRRPVVAETTALGAAYLAGLAVGYWKDLDDVASNWALDREFTPRMDADRRQALTRGWDRAVERSLRWIEP
jgi:glycerol kinase